jgi:hypothetical protein
MNIRRLTLFDQLVDLAGAAGTPPPIEGYSGKRLYITQISVDAAGLLVIQIDDNGPPNQDWPSLRNPVPAQVYALISTDSDPHIRSDAAALPAEAVGRPLVLTGTLGPDGSTPNNLLVPAVNVWAPQKRDREYLSFVSVKVNSINHEIRWVESPLETFHTDNAAVIPPPPGGGIMGPWGLEGS